MKKVIVITLSLLIFLLTTGVASAWYRYPYHHYYPHFGIFIGPPVIWTPPPVYYRGYYSPYSYYPPDSYGDQAWVPGHWEERWTPYGWEKVWIPGYWQYNY